MARAREPAVGCARDGRLGDIDIAGPTAGGGGRKVAIVGYAKYQAARRRPRGSLHPRQPGPDDEIAPDARALSPVGCERARTKALSNFLEHGQEAA